MRNKIINNLQNQDVSVVLSNYKNEKIELDSSVVIDFAIHESLNDNVIHGEITILDIGGFEERVPIMGVETENKHKFASKDLSQTFRYRINILSFVICPKLIDESRNKHMYCIFVSKEYIANLNTKCHVHIKILDMK